MRLILHTNGLGQLGCNPYVTDPNAVDYCGAGAYNQFAGQTACEANGGTWNINYCVPESAPPSGGDTSGDLWAQLWNQALPTWVKPILPLAAMAVVYFLVKS